MRKIHLLRKSERKSVGTTLALTVGSPSFDRRYSALKHLTFMLLFLLGSLNVWGADASVGDVLWGEDFGHYAANDVPSKKGTGTGTTVYGGATITYSNGSNVKAYSGNGQTYAGGSGAELYIKSGSSWTISGIPTGGATEMTLTYKSNNTNSSVATTDSPSGISISGSSKNYTITNTNGANSLTLVFSAASGNTRLDDIQLVVKTAAATGCDQKVTLTTGSDPNGTFKLSKSNGEYDNCDENFVVTVSDIRANSGFYCSGVTATGGNSEVTGPDGSGNYTVTYTKGNNITSTITANFAPKTPRTVTFKNNGAQYDVRNLYDGDAVETLPTAPSSCKEGKVFVGWSENNIGVTPTEDAPSFISASTVVSGSDKVYYAVFATLTPGEEDVLAQTLSYDTWTYSGSTTNKSTYRLFGNNAYVESASFDLSTLSKVVVYGGTFGGAYNSLTIGDGTNEWKSVTVTGNKETGVNEYTGGMPLSGNGTLRIKSNSGDGSNNGVRISKVEIYTKPNVYSGYFTECCTELASIAEQVSMEQTEATLTWDAIEGVTAWSVTGNVKNGAAITSGIGAITDAAGNKKQCVITGLTPATQYEFQIHATSFSTGYCTDVNQWGLEGTTDAAYTIIAGSNDNTLGTVSREGNVITGTPAENCRYASPAFTISPANSATVVQNGNEFTVTPTASTTITIHFEAIPSHTVTWSANGSTTTDEFLEGASIEFPASATGCATKVFQGWVASPIDGETDVEPSYVTEATMGTENLIYYAVFAKETQGSASLTKMSKGNTLSAGDKVIIVAKDQKVALYQETINTSYVKKWTFEGSDPVLEDLDDVKKTLDVSAGSNGKLKFGDATNGYLYDGSSNKLYVGATQGEWTLADNNDGTFSLTGANQKLSYRNDITTGDNAYLWRGGNTNGVSNFYIYKYAISAPTYSQYATTCTPQVATPTFDGVTSGEDCNEVKSVTISSATEGASIYYTTNGDNPTTGSTLYEEPITLAGGTHTIKAIAVKDGMDDSEIAPITFTQPYKDIADFIANGSTTDAKKLVLTGAVVLGTAGKNIYVQDASGAIILYNNSAVPTWASGKEISGYVVGKKGTYQDMPEVTACDFSHATAENAGTLPQATVITEATNANLCKLVKIEGVKFQATELASEAVTVKKGEIVFTIYDSFGQLTKTLPNKATDCDVTGVLNKYNDVFQIAPISVDGITTNGAYAILPTLSTVGSTDSENPTAVAEGKVITITPADGMTSTLKDGDAETAEFVDETNVTINADKSITVSASAYYYIANSATYYYHVDESLTERAISKAAMSNGSVTIKNGGDEVSSAVADATITLLVTPSEHYQMSNITVTDEDEGNVDVTPVIAGEKYTFRMPAKAVTVNATFAEDAYAMVTFAKGDESATGTAPSSFKKYVGQEAIMPANTFTLSGNSFTGWKYGNDTYNVSAGYTILAQDAEIGGKTITFEAQWEPYPWAGNGKWELVTDASELVTSPKMYIIFAKNNKAGGAQNNNYRKLEDVTIADGLLTWTGDDPAVFTLESGNVENTFAFADAANGGYLNANGTGKDNYLTTTESKASNNASWGIESINAETGEAVIKAKSSNRNMLSINTQQSRLSAYSQAQAGLQVFKFVAGSYFNINYAKGVEVEEEDNVSNMPSTQVTASDGTATLSDKVPVYVGYVFEGWKLDENTTYQPSVNVGPLSQNITLTAQWTAAEKHMLSYNKNGGEGDVDVDTEYYPNDVVTLAGALTKDGLIFAGWEYDGNVYAAGAQFTMPDQDVVMTAKFVQGAVYTFPGTAQGTTVVAGAPEGSTFVFTNEGNYNSSQVQLTGNPGQTMTLTLSGYDLYTIKAITLNMRSNTSSGAGTFSATINGNTVAELAEPTDFNAWFDNIAYSTTNRDVHVTMTPARVQPNQKVVITLTGKANSIYIKSVTVEYELEYDVLRDGLYEGKWGTICPKQTVENVEGATFYQISYLEEQGGLPYNVVFDEISGTTLTAGKPYFFIAEGTEIRGIKTGTELTEAGAGVNGFYGYIGASSKELTVYNTDYNAAANNTFVIYNNSVYRINQGGTKLKSERCYININSTEPSRSIISPAPGRNRIRMSVQNTNVATGMDAINASEKPMKLMIDGQLFILCGEKMYDATGRLVK